jgi:hypothetical protein
MCPSTASSVSGGRASWGHIFGFDFVLMNDLLNVLLIYLLEFPFPFSGTGGCHARAWHDEVMHAEGLAEAAILTSASFMIDLVKGLLIFLFGLPLLYSGTGATPLGA